LAEAAAAVEAAAPSAHRTAIEPLTGVRAFAALWVVLHHLRPGPLSHAAIPPAIDLGVFRLGYLGVDLFGFLSGFVIAYNYAERLQAFDPARSGRYLWLRAARIFPLHWFALLLLLAARIRIDGFDAGVNDSLYRAGDFAKSMLMVHGWGFSRLSWNLPSWTVSAEWLCYLAFPLLAPWLVRERDGARGALLAALFVIGTALAMRAVGHADFDAAADWGWIRIGGEFLAGCLLQRAHAAGWARLAPWEWLGPGAVLAAAVLSVFGSAAAIVACLALLVYALAHDRGPLARLLSTRPIVFLGEASYAVYLMHWVVLRVLLHVCPDPLAGTAWRGSMPARFAFDLAAIGAVSIAVHLAVEAPARRRLRRWVAPP